MKDIKKDEREEIQENKFEDNGKQTGGISITETMQSDKIPKDLQEIKILKAVQMVNGKEREVNLSTVIISNPGEVIRVNLNIEELESQEDQE